MMQYSEWEQMAAHVRKFCGAGAEVGGYNSHDVVRLQRLARQADALEAEQRAKRPLIEAGTRLHQTRQRVHKAWQKIEDAQQVLFRERRVHEINGAPSEFFERLDVPQWEEHGRTVEEIDALNEGTAMLATKWEARAGKIVGYANGWASMTPEERNRSLILALAERLDSVK